MGRKNRSKKGGQQNMIDRYDREYISLPEYPQYKTITAIPLKTILINLEAGRRADDFYVARSENDPVLRRIIKKIAATEVIA